MITPIALHDQDLVEQIWHLQHAAYRLEANQMGLRQIPDLPDTFESIRRSEDCYYGYFGVSGDLLGAISISVQGLDSVTITRLMVDPNYLRQGIGRKLLEYVLVTHSETKRFIVNAAPLNKPAVSLYSRYGFVPVHTYEAIAGIELKVYHLNT